MVLEKLNFPEFEFKNKLVNGSMQIFDCVRKSYFVLTPEEWVRQHVIHYLNNYKNYPLALMQVEKLIKYNNLNTRADLIIRDRNFNATILVECKAPSVKINKNAFDFIIVQIRKNFESVKVETNEMVGPIAAQSIGEPATQMTLNTWHVPSFSSVVLSLISLITSSILF